MSKATNSNPQANDPAPTVYPDRYFLGVRTEARRGWDNFLLAPQATRSTKPDSIAKEVAEKREKQMAEANLIPVAGTLVEAAVLDQNGQRVFEVTQSPNEPPGEASIRLLTFLGTVLSSCLMSPAPRLFDTQTRLFGFFIRDRMRLIGVDALGYCRNKGIAPSIPVGTWYHRPFEPPHYLDPYEVFVPSDSRREVDIAGICDFLRIPMPPVQDMMRPVVQAELSRQLAIAGQMFVTAGPG